MFFRSPLFLIFVNDIVDGLSSKTLIFEVAFKLALFAKTVKGNLRVQRNLNISIAWDYTVYGR